MNIPHLPCKGSQMLLLDTSNLYIDISNFKEVGVYVMQYKILTLFLQNNCYLCMYAMCI